MAPLVRVNGQQRLALLDAVAPLLVEHDSYRRIDAAVHGLAAGAQEHDRVSDRAAADAAHVPPRRGRQVDPLPGLGEAAGIVADGWIPALKADDLAELCQAAA